MKRKFSLFLLAALLMSTFSSCGGTVDTNTEQTTSISSDTVTETETEPVETSGVPYDLDLEEQKINVWTTAKDVSPYTSIDGEETGDKLDDATYSLILEVETKLNCDIVFTDTSTPQANVNTVVQKLLLSDDTSYDIFNVTEWSGAKLVGEGLFLNVADAPYISIDKPWWDATTMEEMSIGNDKMFALVGDYSVDRTRFLNCMYYNRNLYEAYYKDANAMYTLVQDGKWTYDELRRISRDVYSDLNNNGEVDKDDKLGIALQWNGNILGLFFGADVPITERDKNDIPQLIFNNERTINAVQKLNELVHNTEGILYLPSSDIADAAANVTSFEKGNAMFCAGFFYTCESLRDMKDDYGIIPMPKLDDNQEEYVTFLHQAFRFMALPANCQKVDAVCAVLEEMSFRGYNELLPVYYETVLKNKYARDDTSAQMLDLIRMNSWADIAYLYGSDFSNVAFIPRTLIAENSTDFVSKYKSIEEKAKTSSQNLIDHFINID